MRRQRWVFAAVVGLLSLGSARLSTAAPIEELKAQAKAPPKDPAAALELGQALRRAGLFDDAVRVLRRSYGKATQGELAVELRLTAARSLIEAGKQKEAVRECASLRGVSMPKADVCTAEAHLLWRRATLALPAAERALSKSSADYDALVAKGRALRMMGKTKEAQAALEAAMAADASGYSAPLYLGELLVASKQPKAAVVALEKAHTAAPEEPVPMLELARALGSDKKATVLLQKAIAVRPGFGAAHALLGEVLLDGGDVAGAQAALEKAVAIDAKQADWQASLGRVHVARGAAADALAVAKKALKLVGNHAVAKLVEAEALALKGDIDLAIEAYEQAHGYARTDPKPLVAGARASLKHARPTTARAFADRATQSFPDYAPGWEVLGDVAAAAKDKDAARAAYKKALKAKGPLDRQAVEKKLARL